LNRLLSQNSARRLFLLYSPSRPLGWLLRWVFFTLLITTAAGIARGLLGMSYLPVRVLIPFVMVTFLVAVLVRWAALRMERADPVNSTPRDTLAGNSAPVRNVSTDL